jgi:NAD(P)-dependent dehydrogenase (short-subunit alcohol dehydrogenase family)
MTVNNKSSAPVCVITGPTNGIGRETAKVLSVQGFKLILLCRDAVKGKALAAELESDNCILVVCDLSSLKSVRDAVAVINNAVDHIDVLINNAGIVASSRELNADGFELMFATNHLGPFLLTNLLLPKIIAAPHGRIVNVASAAHGFVKKIQFDDLNYAKGFTTFGTYGHSKLCNMLMTLTLCEKLTDTNVVCNSLHPGAVSTNLGTQNGMFAKVIFNLVRPFFRSVAKGAQSSVWLASNDDAALLNDLYFYDCKPIKPKPWARDKATADKLWLISEQLTGLAEHSESRERL